MSFTHGTFTFSYEHMTAERAEALLMTAEVVHVGPCPEKTYHAMRTMAMSICGIYWQATDNVTGQEIILREHNNSVGVHMGDATHA